MATLSFRKLSSTASFPTSDMTEGTIYFCPKDHTIGIATSATTVEKYYGGNVKDAKYADDKLTITYNDGTAEAVLDFSDMASAKNVAAELNKLKALHAKDGANLKTVAAEINDALGGLNLTQVGAAGKYISAVSQVDGQVAATASSFDTSIPASDPSASNAPTTAAVKTYVDSKVSDTKTSLNYTDTPAENQYVSAVNQSNGVISVTRKALPSLNGDILTNNVETDGLAPTSGAVKDYVTSKVADAKSSLDFTDDVTGNYVTSISRADGVVTISKSNFDTSIAADSKSKVAPTSEAVAGFVKTQLSSLGNALHFRGAGTKDQMTALENKADGDIYIINSGAEQGKEYVYSGGVWVELGDEGKAASLINALDVTDTEVTGQYVSKVDQVDGKIKVTRKALPTPTYNSTIATNSTTTDGNAPTSGAVKTYVEGKITSTLSDLKTTNAQDQQAPLAAGDGKFVSSVGQQNGKVSIGSTAFTADIAASTTVTDKVAPTTAAVKTYVEGKINGLDVTAIGGPSKIITTVAQVDGKVQATTSPVDTVIDTTTAVDSTPDTIHIPTTKAVKSYVDTEVSKAVNGALIWSSWE